MGKTNIQKLSDEFDKWNIVGSCEMLPQKQYEEMNMLAGKMLSILNGGKS